MNLIAPHLGALPHRVLRSNASQLNEQYDLPRVTSPRFAAPRVAAHRNAMNNPLPNDDYASMTGGEQRERVSRQRQAFALMRELDPRLASFRCRMCGEWFRMNFKSASNQNVCNQCEP